MFLAFYLIFSEYRDLKKIPKCASVFVLCYMFGDQIIFRERTEMLTESKLHKMLARQRPLIWSFFVTHEPYDYPKDNLGKLKTKIKNLEGCKP